jgi:hypothetical protein
LSDGLDGINRWIVKQTAVSKVKHEPKEIPKKFGKSCLLPTKGQEVVGYLSLVERSFERFTNFRQM